MKYSVYQHWDPLKVCIVGKSYSPEFYSFIANSRVRAVMEQIAQETEEDYQNIIKKLEEFGVKILRPVVHNDYKHYLSKNGKIYPPPMTPRDWSVMIGDTFYHNWITELQMYNDIKAEQWPTISTIEEFNNLEDYKKQEVYDIVPAEGYLHYSHIIEFVKRQGNKIVERPLKRRGYYNSINGAMVSRIGKDLYFGTENYDQDTTEYKKLINNEFTNTRNHIVNTGGHSDAIYCPVCPGLIISLKDVPTYADTFPDWEVVYLPGQSWDKVKPFLNLKKKNAGKWWVPGEELNDDFTTFVESWLNHWVGYVEETVFDVNMLVIDPKNVIVFNYNKQVFDALERYGITPHVVPFRHRYFWDGGIHCITSDLHREGTMKDYFPERSEY